MADRSVAAPPTPRRLAAAARRGSGYLPSRSDEIGLGTNTASERGIGVGDTVTIGGPFDAFDATVTGLVVFPTIGPIFAEAVGGGNGMLLPQAMIEAVATPAAAVELATFVGVELADDADPGARARLEGGLRDLDLLGYPPVVYHEPVRPPEVIEAAATRSVPVAVGASLAVIGGVGLAVGTWASVRARRRDLAVLRALGFSPRQVRYSVRSQSVAITLAALTFGVPLGVVAGRVSWRVFAQQLGVVPDPSSALGTVAAVVAVSLLLAIVAAQLPARNAATIRPAVGLRVE